MWKLLESEQVWHFWLWPSEVNIKCMFPVEFLDPGSSKMPFSDGFITALCALL